MVVTASAQTGKKVLRLPIILKASRRRNPSLRCASQPIGEFVVVVPKGGKKIYGEDEKSAFERVSPLPAEEVGLGFEKLCYSSYSQPRLRGNIGGVR